MSGRRFALLEQINSQVHSALQQLTDIFCWRERHKKAAQAWSVPASSLLNAREEQILGSVPCHEFLPEGCCWQGNIGNGVTQLPGIPARQSKND